MWGAGHRWPVFGAWFVLTLGLFAASMAAGGTRTIDVNEDPSGPRLAAEEAYDTLGAGGAGETGGGGAGAGGGGVVAAAAGGAGAAANPTFRAAVATLVADLGAAHATVDGN